MAVRTACTRCKKSFTAQEEYLGERVKCPSCGTRVLVLDDESRQQAASRAREREDWRKDQEERIRLVESRGGNERESLASEFGVSLDRVRNFHPGAVSRFRKLRALSRFMLLGAYLFLPMVLVGAAMTVLLFHEIVDGNPLLLAVMLLGWLLLLVFSFFLFKFLGEMSWLLADLGDHQLDVRNLLLDLSDDAGRALNRAADSPTEDR